LRRVRIGWRGSAASGWLRRGVLSYCKARALTRIATADNESYLLSIAEVGTVSHVEKTVRLYRRSEPRGGARFT
jgi:hypothetical protein